MTQSNTLKKEMGFLPALAIVIGSVIGSGVFFKAQAVSANTGDESLAMFAWFLGGVITICAGMTAAEVAAAVPKQGGMIAYIRYAYGDLWGFIVGWVLTVIYIPATMAALGSIFATQAVALMGLDEGLTVPVAILTIVFLTLVNFIGARASGLIQTFATIAKLVPIGIIIVVGLINGGTETVSLFPVQAGEDVEMTAALGAALLGTMFAYDGWITVGTIAGEMKNPSRDLPRAIIIGLSVVMSVYLLINFVYYKYATVAELAASDTPAALVAGRMFGEAGATLITIGILISVFGALNGYVMTSMRIPYVMGKTKQLPFSDKFASLSKNGIPVFAGLYMMVMATIFVIFFNFNRLTDMVTFMIWIFYIMIFIAVFILRKREPELVRPYKVPLYPVLPVVAILGGLFIVLSMVVNNPKDAVIGIGLTLLGLIVYHATKKNHVAYDE